MPSIQRQSVTEKILSMPLGHVVKDFLDYLRVEAGLAENTTLAYGRDLKEFLQYCKSNNINKLKQIKPAFIQKYIILQTKASKAESSIKRSLVAIRMLLRFARLTNLIEDDFTAILA